MLQSTLLLLLSLLLVLVSTGVLLGERALLRALGVGSGEGARELLWRIGIRNACAPRVAGVREWSARRARAAGGDSEASSSGAPASGR